MDVARSNYHNLHPIDEKTFQKFENQSGSKARYLICKMNLGLRYLNYNSWFPTQSRGVCILLTRGKIYLHK